MADFSALKTSIQNYIKQNGNEEITGNLLQKILLSMVSTLGDSAINDLVTALNAEIANRGNADTELGGRITTLQGVVNSIDDAPTQGSNNLVKSGGVFNSINGITFASASTLSNYCRTKNNPYGETYLGYFNVEAGHKYRIYVKSDSLLKDGNVTLGLGYNGSIEISASSIVDGYTWEKVATTTSDKGRVYITMVNGNEDINLFVSIVDLDRGIFKLLNDFKFNEIDVKWYVGDVSNGPLFNNRYSLTFSPVVKCRKYNGITTEHSADIFNVVKNAIDNYHLEHLSFSYDITERTVTVNILDHNNTHCTIYYNIIADSYRFAINTYDMTEEEVMVLDICAVNDGLTFNGKAGIQWTAYYNWNAIVDKYPTGRSENLITSGGVFADNINERLYNIGERVKYTGITEAFSLSQGPTLIAGFDVREALVHAYIKLDRVLEDGGNGVKVGLGGTGFEVFFTAQNLYDGVFFSTTILNASNSRIFIDPQKAQASVGYTVTLWVHSDYTKSIMATERTTLLQTEGVLKNSITIPIANDAVPIIDTFYKKASNKYSIFIKASNLNGDGNARFGLGGETAATVSYSKLRNGYTKMFTATNSGISRVWLDDVPSDVLIEVELIDRTSYFDYGFVNRNLSVYNQITTRNNHLWNINLNTLNLLHFSDIHGDKRALERIMKYYSYCKVTDGNIHDIINTGDSVNYEFSDGIDFIHNTPGAENILNVIGNHDSNIRPYDWYGKNAEECYNQFFAPFIENWECDYTENLCYYKKDYTAKGIRLIVLDNMHWDNAQLIWLQGMLSDAVSNSYSVIIVAHCPPAMYAETDELKYSTFNAFYADFENESHFSYSILNSNVLDAVDSFISNGGDFVCYLCGHTHTDYIRTVKNHPNQLFVAVANASNYNTPYYNGQNMMCYMPRTDITEVIDLFNVICFDKKNAFIYIHRVGADYDGYGRHIGTIMVDYRNKKLLANY